MQAEPTVERGFCGFPLLFGFLLGLLLLSAGWINIVEPSEKRVDGGIGGGKL